MLLINKPLEIFTLFKDYLKLHGTKCVFQELFILPCGYFNDYLSNATFLRKPLIMILSFTFPTPYLNK